MSISSNSLSQSSEIPLVFLSSCSITPINLNPIPENQEDITQKVDGCRKRNLTPQASDSTSGVVFRSHSQDLSNKRSKLSHLPHTTDEKARSVVVIKSISNCSIKGVKEDSHEGHLTDNLADKTKEINQAYCESKASKHVTQDPCEGQLFELSRGYVRLGKLIGQGTFGLVYKGVYTLKESSKSMDVAFKVNKFVNSEINYFYAASVCKEAYILKLLRINDLKDFAAVAHILDDGQVSENHFGMVQHLYKINLRQLIGRYHPQGLSLLLVQRVASQILDTLMLLKSPQVNLVHADIKLENIVLENPQQFRIRLIDFGSAKNPLDVSDPNLYICSRCTRPPEVVFKMPYDQSFDIWSLGCLLFEIHTGKPLFPANDSDDLIQMIIELLGPPSQRFIKKIPNWQNYFTPSITDSEGYDYIKQKNRQSTYIDKRRYFEEKLSLENIQEHYPSKDSFYQTEKSYDLFKQFLRSMIAWDLADRLSAKDLNSHSFFSKIFQLNYEFNQQKLAKQDVLNAQEN